MASFRRFPGSWRRLGDVSTERTVAAFATVARAASVLCRAVGAPADRGLAWRDDGAVLVTDPLHRDLRLALRPADLTLLALGDEGRVPDRLPLDGRTATDLVAWVRHRLGIALADGVPVETLPYDAADRPAFAEAARWLNDADDAFDHAGLAARFGPDPARLAAFPAFPGTLVALEVLPEPAFVVHAGDLRTGAARLEAREIVGLPSFAQAARVASFLGRATGLSAWER